MSKPGSFADNGSTKEVFKASLFKNLLGARKSLLDGGSYPAVSKGLKFPDPNVSFSHAAYTFKTTDTCDKVTYNGGGDQSVEARYKKDTRNWDIVYKQRFGKDLLGFPGFIGMIKYEERASAAGQPAYVFGAEFTRGLLNIDPLNALQANVKYNPSTGLVKGSAIYNCGEFVKGLRVGGDLKVKAADATKALANPLGGGLAFNVGACMNHGSALGTTMLAFNNTGLVTASHVMELSKGFTGAVELVQSTNNGPVKAPIVLAAGYKLDSQHTLKGRLNKDGQLNLVLDKSFSPKFNMLFSTCVDVSNPDSIFRAPALGVKVVAK